MDGDSTQKPMTPIRCANIGCLFFGNSVTANMCSKCYRDTHTKKEEEKATPTTTDTGKDSTIKKGETQSVESSEDPTPAKKIQSDTTKCFSCNKKVGLLGFKCRCEYIFCSSHRYSDKHNCDFDYKSAGKAALAKANPVVQGSKIERI